MVFTSKSKKRATDFSSFIVALPAACYILNIGLGLHLQSALIFLGFTGAAFSLLRCSGGFNQCSSALWLIFLFMISSAISFFISFDMERSAMLSLSFLPALIVFFFARETKPDAHEKVSFPGLSILALVVSFSALTQPFRFGGEPPAFWISKMDNPNFVVPNDLVLLSILTPFSVSLFLSDRHFLVKSTAALSVAASFATVAFYQSRGAILVAIVGLSIFAINLARRRRTALMIALGVATAGFTDMIMGFPLISKFAGVWSNRLLYWAVAWEMFLDAPLFGHGLRLYGELYPTYKAGVQIPAWVAVDSRLTPWAHNCYLETLAEQGIAGFSVICLLFVWGVWTSLKLFRTSAKHMKPIYLGIAVGFLCFCIAAVFELSFIRHWVVVVFFYLLGLVESFSRSADDKGECQ